MLEQLRDAAKNKLCNLGRCLWPRLFSQPWCLRQLQDGGFICLVLDALEGRINALLVHIRKKWIQPPEQPRELQPSTPLVHGPPALNAAVQIEQHSHGVAPRSDAQLLIYTIALQHRETGFDVHCLCMGRLHTTSAQVWALWWHCAGFLPTQPTPGVVVPAMGLPDQAC